MVKYDVAIIGAGIAGCGAADAVSRAGYSAILLEKTVPLRQTSANSLRIIHGGFRYLQTLDLARLWRSLGDQTAVMREWPAAVRPLRCLMPLRRSGLKSKWPVSFASLLYGSVMRLGASPLPHPKVSGASCAEDIHPLIAPLFPHGGLEWWDGVMTDPALLHRTLLSMLGEQNVKMREYAEVTAIEDGDAFRVHFKEGESISARVVVNCAGPWIEGIRMPEWWKAPQVQWCKGFNLVVSRALVTDTAVGVESRSGRLFFLVPRGEFSAIGTWYEPLQGADREAAPTAAEIQRFLAAFEEAVPGASLSSDDIVAADAGILPMKHVGSKGPVLHGSEIVRHDRGIIEVLSTKYTTFLSQGERIAALVRKYL